jgi:hypothetical protein
MGAYPTINLNDTVPAAPVDGLNIKFQSVPSIHDPNILNVSGAVVGPGGIDYLRADGTWAPIPAPSPTNGGAAVVETQGYGGFWSDGRPQQASYGYSSTTAGLSSTINQVTVWQFVLESNYTISKILCYIVGTAAGAKVNAGIYSAAGALLIDSGGIAANASGVKGNTITPVTLTPGVYYFAVSSDHTAVTVQGFALTGGGNMESVTNNDYVKAGQAANVTVSNALPATLGTLTADAIFGNMPGFFFQV